MVTLNREQPRDVYPSVWDALEGLIRDGRAFMTREAHEELKRVDDELMEWAKSFEGFIVQTTMDELAVVDSITNDHPGWVQEQQNAADPFIIAHASENDFSIITFERRRGLGVEDRNLGIPNVADEWGIECLNFPDLARKEGWVF